MMDGWDWMGLGLQAMMGMAGNGINGMNPAAAAAAAQMLQAAGGFGMASDNSVPPITLPLITVLENGKAALSPFF